jgi:hypothetical protein
MALQTGTVSDLQPIAGAKGGLCAKWGWGQSWVLYASPAAEMTMKCVAITVKNLEGTIVVCDPAEQQSTFRWCSKVSDEVRCQILPRMMVAA